MRPVQPNPAYSSRALHADEATPHAVSPASEEYRTVSEPALGRAPSRPAATNLPGGPAPPQYARPGTLAAGAYEALWGSDARPRWRQQRAAQAHCRRDASRDPADGSAQKQSGRTVPIRRAPYACALHDGTTLDCDPTTAPPSSTAEALRLFDLNSRTPVPLDTLGTLVEGFGFGRPNETSQAAPAAPSENSDPSRLLRAIREKDPLLGNAWHPLWRGGKTHRPPRRSRRTIRILRPCSSLFAKQIRNWATSWLRYASGRRRAE